MKKIIGVSIVTVLMVLATTISVMSAEGNKRKPTIEAATDQLVELQRTDADWEGTWYWTVGSSDNATNLTGATALGLLEAYRDTQDQKYLAAAEDAADFIQAHLGAGATGTQHWPRLTAPDIVFLHRLSEVTGNNSYADRATQEWDNIKVNYPTAASLDDLFRTLPTPRPSTWDIAFFLEAAYMSGDYTWADDAAAIIADTTDDFYYGATWWYALNVAGSLRALIGCGYAADPGLEVYNLLPMLISVIGENGVDGWIQDTAYAILALNTVGGAVQWYSNNLGRWLTEQQEENGGWIEAGWVECPEVNGEAVRALASTNGNDNTLDGFQPGAALNSSWIRPTGPRAIPFNE